MSPTTSLARLLKLRMRSTWASQAHEPITHVAEAQDLQPQPDVLLDGGEGRGVVLVGHGDAVGLQVVVQRRELVGVGGALAVGQPGDRDARVAVQRGLGAAVGHARVGVAGRAGDPAVDRLDRRRRWRTARCPRRGRSPRSPRRRASASRRAPRSICGVADVGPGDQRAVVHAPAVPALVGALGGADVALAEHQRGAGLAFDEPLERAEVVGGDQVVGVQALGVLAPVHPHGHGLVAGVGAPVEPQQGEVLVAVVVGEPGGRAVVGGLRPHDVALEQRVLDGGRAHAGRGEVGLGLQDRVGHGAGLVLEHAQVDDVLEHPHAPRRGGVVGRGVVVRRGVQDVVVGDLRAGLVEQLPDPAQQVVLREVVVGLDQRHPLPVGALDHDRPDRQPRRDAVGVLLGGGVEGRVDVPARQLVGRVPVVGVLPGRRPDVPGRVGHADAGAQAVPGLVGAGGRGRRDQPDDGGEDEQGRQQASHGRSRGDARPFDAAQILTGIFDVADLPSSWRSRRHPEPEGADQGLATGSSR